VRYANTPLQLALREQLSTNISNPLSQDTASVEFLSALTSTETVVGCKLKRSVIFKHL
jgi:hypothetical protein